MAIINDGVTIDSGLEASVMRRKMESKDTLATRGALYVGTGTKQDSFTVTKSIAPNGSSDNGKVLVADASQAVGWRVDICPQATTATTVSTNIGNQKITDIFESDGKTAKNAVNSTSPLIQGALPTTGWTMSTNQLWTGSVPATLSIPAELRDANLPKCHYEVFSKSLSPVLWKVKTSKTNGDYITANRVERGSWGSDCHITIYFNDASLEVRIYQNKQHDRYYIDCSYMTTPGTIYVEGLQWLGSVAWYSVADAEITSNSDVLIQFSDNSDLIVADKTENGQFTIVRDTVPQVAIPYSYKIKKTNNTGQTTLVNRYSWSTVGEWITVPGQLATLTEAGTYQVVLYGSDRNVQSIIYWDGSTAAQGTYSTVVDLLGGGYPVMASRFPQVTAEGVLSFGWVVITQSDHGWTESNTTVSGFKYRKIN